MRDELGSKAEGKEEEENTNDYAPTIDMSALAAVVAQKAVRCMSAFKGEWINTLSKCTTQDEALQKLHEFIKDHKADKTSAASNGMG